MASTFEFEAIGTHWAIDAVVTEQKRTQILDRIESYDTTYSRFRTDSVIHKIATKSGSYIFPDDSRELFAMYTSMYDVTQGKVTPLIGNALNDAGYDAEYSLQPAKMQPTKRWDDVIGVSGNKITARLPVILDFGAAGKGHLVDIISEMLTGDYIVDAGGDMKISGSHKVGLEHPGDQTQVIGVAEISDMSLCGSAGNRRKWAQYTHILDPDTLQSPTHISAVWVVAKTALLADGMTTCLFFAEPQVLMQKFDFEYVIMFDDNSAQISRNFPGYLL